MEGFANAVYIVPATQCRINGAVVDDGEAIIRGIRKEGEDVNRIDNVGSSIGEQFCQGRQRTVLRAADHIAVGDEDHIALRERTVLAFTNTSPPRFQQLLQISANGVGKLPSVQEVEEAPQVADLSHRSTRKASFATATAFRLYAVARDG